MLQKAVERPPGCPDRDYCAKMANSNFGDFRKFPSLKTKLFHFHESGKVLLKVEISTFAKMKKKGMLSTWRLLFAPPSVTLAGSKSAKI